MINAVFCKIGGINIRRLILKGKKTGKLEVTISSKPDFHDVIYLTKNSPQRPSYEFIPITANTKISFDFADNETHMTFNQEALVLTGCRRLTADQALDIFRTFVIKEGSKVAYLTNCPAVRQGKRTLKVMEGQAEAVAERARDQNA